MNLKKQTTLTILFLSLVLSSCGLIEKFKTPEDATESTADAETASTDESSADQTDDLFENVANSSADSNAEAASLTADSSTEAPGNVNDDLQSLQDEFSSTAMTTPPAAVEKVQEPKKEEAMIPEIKNEVAYDETPSEEHSGGGIKTYKVQKGDTLMQIAFKLYGDISKWKDLRDMNSDKLSFNSSLRANTQLKYHAPAKKFVWKPVGTPHLIKTGETLGIISNSVYGTPSKWKHIWENNRPLIKNPNVIYAGFTLYYRENSMANFVQPEEFQPEKTPVAQEAEESKAVVEKTEEKKTNRMQAFADETLSPTPMKYVDSSPTPVKEEAEFDEQDESIQVLSAPEREAEEAFQKAERLNESVPAAAEEELEEQ